MAVVLFLLGMFTGVACGAICFANIFVRFYRSAVVVEEENVYCDGWQDGLYYALGEPVPELFKVEVAKQYYKEYKTIKHGNVKN